VLVQLHAGEKRRGNLTRFAGGAAVALERELDVLLRRQPVDQALLLEDHAQVDLVARAGERDLAARGLFQPGDEAQQRGLAAARRPDQPHQLAGVHLQPEAVEDGAHCAGAS